MLAYLKAHSSLMDHIHERQFEDKKLCLIRDKVDRCQAKESMLDTNGVFKIGV